MMSHLNTPSFGNGWTPMHLGVTVHGLFVYCFILKPNAIQSVDQLSDITPVGYSL